MTKPKLDKRKLDVAQCFLVYTALVGDVQKAAAALDIEPEILEQLSKEEGWNQKLQRACLLSKSSAPGDYERATNRALAFVQGHRLRALLDRIIFRFESLTPEEICAEVTSVGKGGVRNVSARFFADLAAAAEKANNLTFVALGDSAGERAHRDGPDEELNVTALHQAVIMALSSPGIKGKPADVLVRELAAETEGVVKQLACPTERTEPEPSSQ
jgi:hypothetical protein